ncbi:hypothetical protein J2W69_002150 [Rheinheimera soli]|uniref:Uncharacterized protein n=1 Tax=Rheinheimera soli TaxID=443616 RepID=A0ABU1W0K0_9GAMM|nr:hypothetical protein [Rheinheimera soli]
MSEHKCEFCHNMRFYLVWVLLMIVFYFWYMD